MCWGDRARVKELEQEVKRLRKALLDAAEVLHNCGMIESWERAIAALEKEDKTDGLV